MKSYNIDPVCEMKSYNIGPDTDYSDWEIFLLSSIMQTNSRMVHIQILSSLLFVMYSQMLIAVFCKP
jgi:hypothetical protein